MVIYLQHPKHGTKVACSDEEAKEDEKVGWTRYSVNTPIVAVVLSTAVHAVEQPETWGERAALVEKYKERFGKKPHHKKSIETLRSELA